MGRHAGEVPCVMRLLSAPEPSPDRVEFVKLYSERYKDRAVAPELRLP